MRRVLGVIGMCLLPVAMSAQQTEKLRSGVKVRIGTFDGLKAEGYLEHVGADVLVLRVAKSDQMPFQIRRDAVRWAEVEKRHTFRALVKGALLGLLVGGGTGFLVGALTYDDGDCDILVCSSAQAGTLLGFVGGVVGAPIGALIGAAKGDSEWRPVGLASVKP